jgi:hypothetical protein
MSQYLVLLSRGHRAVREEAPALSHAEWLELAYVLATDPRAVCRAHNEGEEAWAEEVAVFASRVQLDEMPALRAVIQDKLREAFAASPPPTGGADADEKKKIAEDDWEDLLSKVRGPKAGNGWVLGLLDLVWAQYSWGYEDSLHDTPLAVLFLAYRQRAVIWESKGVPTLSQQQDLADNRELYKRVLRGEVTE